MTSFSFSSVFGPSLYLPQLPLSTCPPQESHASAHSCQCFLLSSNGGLPFQSTQNTSKIQKLSKFNCCQDCWNAIWSHWWSISTTSINISKSTSSDFVYHCLFQNMLSFCWKGGPHTDGALWEAQSWQVPNRHRKLLEAQLHLLWSPEGIRFHFISSNFQFHLPSHIYFSS